MERMKFAALLLRCSLEKAVHEVAADMGGSALLALRVVLHDGTFSDAFRQGYRDSI